MTERAGPKVYSIAAHRGFADALVAGLVPRYAEDDFGLARLTLLLPSSRAARTLTEAFVRYCGENDMAGMLMPRMVMVGDLDLGEALGPMLDPLGTSDILPATDPTRRWLELAKHIAAAYESEKRDVPSGAALLRLAREMGATLDRLTAEEVTPEDVLSPRVKNRFPDVAEHWQNNLWLFAIVQRLWQAELAERGEIDAADRRNQLFDKAASDWRASPPQTPIVAAGVTSAAPALARLLRVVADLPNGAVILPDLDLNMDDAAWDELGRAGQSEEPEGEVFGAGDAVTHPQYHLKLLLGRMGINRGEVEPWHRKGMAASAPERSKAISALFLPPEASKSWADMPPSNRSLSGVEIMALPTLEEEAQAIALLIRQTLEEPEKRAALITPDRGLARRVVGHLKRWGIDADDTAGRPLHLTAAGRLLLQLAELISDAGAPVALIAALSHPLVKRGDERGQWLEVLRKFDVKLRGPRPAPGLAPLKEAAQKAGVEEWWDALEPILGQLLVLGEAKQTPLADALVALLTAADALAGEGLWGNEDGRALSRFVEELREHSRAAETLLNPAELHMVLSEAMAQIAVRPPYGGHPRMAIYGLLESRMTRADLVICGGLNEGSWPRIPSPDPLLAPPILRALGVPGADFRIGLSAHDLAGALGAPKVVLSRSARDAEGPAIPSRFLLRVEALLGELGKEHRQEDAPKWAKALDRQAAQLPQYGRPKPNPNADLRDVPIKVTGLDRLLGDAFQFYASDILRLSEMEALDEPIGPAWQGTVAHEILDTWHKARENDPAVSISQIANEHLEGKHVHALLWGLWQPRLLEALEWIAAKVREAEPERRVIASECKGGMTVDGVRIHGRADRIDRLADGSLTIVDYKTGKPPSYAEVDAGFALQLGLLGMIASDEGFKKEGQIVASGEARGFEYWSLKKDKDSFGLMSDMLKIPRKKNERREPEDFLAKHAEYLDKAITEFIKGTEPFTARHNPDYKGYNTYDQLMRLDEWERNLGDEAGDAGDAS
ncbi:MAG: PD-(D/E)XK nuclease family protein [Marinomonas sp.]